MNKWLELLFLKQIKGLGTITINRKYRVPLNTVSGLDECVKLVREISPQISIKELDRARREAEKRHQFVSGRKDIQVMTIFDDDYHDGFRSMGDKRPPIIYAKGNVEALQDESVAIVGTRKPSEWSAIVEKNLVKKMLEQKDPVIVSGLALGCDTIAHEMALQERARTIAVLPCGFEVATPIENRPLAERIVSHGGCLISEYEPYDLATKYTFVERDAIIAAQSDAVIAIECGLRSGTMHTMEAAYDMKIDIGCYYPDDMSKGRYEGNAYLIENLYAMKISDTDDLIKFLKEGSEKNPMDKLVETNIGKIPVRDYLEIQASKYGFDSYEDLHKAGYRIQGYENVFKPIEQKTNKHELLR